MILIFKIFPETQTFQEKFKCHHLLYERSYLKHCDSNFKQNTLKRLSIFWSYSTHFGFTPSHTCSCYSVLQGPALMTCMAWPTRAHKGASLCPFYPHFHYTINRVTIKNMNKTMNKPISVYVTELCGINILKNYYVYHSCVCSRQYIGSA